MIILAGAIIVTLSNTGIMNKAQQAVDKTDMKQIETLASTLWADAYLDGARTKEDLEKAVKDGLAANKITEQHYEGYELYVTTTGVELKYIDPALNPEKAIPEGGTYYVGVTSTEPGYYTGATDTYVAGDKFPEKVTTGDVYVFGDYEYRYNNIYTEIGMGTYGWATNESQDGWAVKVLDTSKSSYGEILESINKASITNMQRTFWTCSALTTAPVIPNSVTNMGFAFVGCSALTTAPVIPNSVTNMSAAFLVCSALTTVPYISNNVTDMSDAFARCTALTTVPTISNKVNNIDMTNTFSSCKSLVTAPELLNGVTHMTDTFSGCSALTTVPTIPGTVKTMNGTFSSCGALVTVPAIPNGVTDMSNAFSRCTALTTVPTIPNTVTNMEHSFYACTSLATVPDIPSSVENMEETFAECTSLTGTITINANPTSYRSCFYLWSAGKDITLAGSSSAETKHNLANTSNSTYRKVYDEAGTLLK